MGSKRAGPVRPARPGVLAERCSSRPVGGRDRSLGWPADDGNREEHGRGREQRPLTGWDKPELDLSNAQWQSSSRGLGDVQIAFVEGFIAMRNSGRPESPSLIFTPAEWGAFVSGAREGDFDLT